MEFNNNSNNNNDDDDNDDDDDDDDNDIWNEDEDYNDNDIAMASNDINAISSSMRQSGYRRGRQEEDDRQGQIGFNQGLFDGFKHGHLCGQLYSECILMLNKKRNSNANNVKAELYYLFFEVIPEMQDIDIDTLNKIKNTIISIDQDLLTAYESFSTSLKM